MTTNKLSLDQLMVYEITVPGKFEHKYLDWNGGLKIKYPAGRTPNAITTIIITVDQAGLQGFLRYLYSLGLPLISVLCVDYINNNNN
mgnify:CR=1 FL=1